MASPADNTKPPTEETSMPQRCAAGCGFFGSAATGGMCSKCFKDNMAKAAASAAPAPSPVAAATPPVAAPAKPPTPPPAAPAAVCQPVSAPAAVAPEPAAAPVDVSEPVAAPVASAAAATPPAPAPTPAAEPAASSSSLVCGVVRASEDAPPEDEPPRKVQTNTSRCWTCNRKIGLLGFQCKCEYFFCSEHRYSDKHECHFDFKAKGKQELTKANPTIAPAKLEKC